MDETVIDGLVSSIKHCGLLQPIMVTRRGDEFEVVFGNHRVEACRRLSWKEIPATIVEATEKEFVLLQIVENIQRNIRINPVNEAKAYKFLVSEGMTVPEIAHAVGKSYQYVWSKIRLLETLHPRIVERLEQDGFRNLTVSHAEQLSLIKDRGKQLELAGAIEDYSMSIRELERIVSQSLFGHVSSGTRSKDRSSPLPVWKKGDNIFVEKTRHGLVSYTTFNAMVDSMGRRARSVGRRAGRMRRNAFLQTAKRTMSKTDWVLRCFNECCGWGRLAIDGSKVVLSNSITTNSLFLMGYVEGLLGIRLKRVISSTGVNHRFEGDKT